MKCSDVWAGVSFVFSLSFLLNFLWETTHAFSLYSLSGMVVPEYVNMIFRVSFIDALIISGIFLLGCFIFSKDRCWLESYGVREVTFTGVAGIIIAVFIEVKALFLGQWQYNEIMPLVFGIGLSPLIQLAVTGIFTLLIVSFLVRQLTHTQRFLKSEHLTL